MNWWFLTLGRNFSEMNKYAQCDHTLIEPMNWHKTFWPKTFLKLFYPSGLRQDSSLMGCMLVRA